MSTAGRFDAEHLARQASGFIDPESSEPLYRQVRRYIESSIANGTFRHNRPMPSSRFLSAALGVSRNTVNIAYQELVALALIESRPRSGLYPAQRATHATALTSAPPTAPVTGPDAAGPASTGVDWSARITPSFDDLPPLRLRTDWANFPYPFIPGQPDVAQFPVRGWLRALSEATGRPHLRHSLQDSVDLDDPLLVEVIRRELLPGRGVTATADQILITNGAQQALALIADALVRPRTTVAIESPGYRDAAHILVRAGATLRHVPVDEHGADVPDDGGHDLVYLTPSHHHPTNVTLSLDRRRALLAAAERDDTLVIEDDYDSEVRFVGRPTASLKSLDRSGRVVYVGTFSKFVAPGLRLGFVVGDAELVTALRHRRRYSTKHPSGHVQRALGLFIESGDYHRELRRHRNHLKQKWQLVSDLLPETLGFDPGTMPAGGMGLWVRGPSWFDATAVAEAAVPRGVLVDPGEQFYFTADPPHNEMRVGFSAIALEHIADGMRALGQAVRDVHPR